MTVQEPTPDYQLWELTLVDTVMIELEKKLEQDDNEWFVISTGRVFLK